jgi:hypothetical protein
MSKEPQTAIDMLDELIYEARIRRSTVELQDLLLLREVMDVDLDTHATEVDQLRDKLTTYKCPDCGYSETHA